MARQKQTSSSSRASRPKLPPEYDYLTPEERERLHALADPTVSPPLTFMEFVNRVRPGYLWYQYNTRLAGVLQLVADGFYKRVMAYMPPRLGKSEEISKLFSAYYLYRFPSRWVAIASYGAELAYEMSRHSRANYIDGRGTAHTGGETEAVKHWENGEGGGEWAVGVRGPATGKGASLFIIDDPVKDEEEASSEVIQTRNLNWFDAVVMTRLAKDAAVVIVQTRFNQKDLSGALLERENGDAPERWHIVCFPAEFDEGAANLTWPKTCTVEPDWRTIRPKDRHGLRWTVCPERIDPAFLAQRKRANVYVWNALFQQNPTPHEGGKFKRAWFEIVPAAPPATEFVLIGRWWDLGATEDGGTYTVGLKMGRTRGDRYYIFPLVRGQWGEGKRDAIIRQTAQLDGPEIKQYGPQDPGQAGKTAAAAFRKLLDGFVVQTIIESGDKETRAGPFASAAYTEDAASGRVKLIRGNTGEWIESFLAELASFPYGGDDDQVDAASNIYNVLSLWRRPQIKAARPQSVWTG